MYLHRGLPLLAFTLAALAIPALAQAATAECMGEYGTCQVTNDGAFDEAECMCADGGGGGFGGGNEWAGLSEAELLPICEEVLADFCGPFVPPDDVWCSGLLGSCLIENEPQDSIYCECIDGTTPTMEGGMAWAGYSYEELYGECEVQLDMYCVLPPGTMECENGSGSCSIANMPTDLLVCECGGGDGGSFSGGNAWAGYSELELFEECASQLVGLCGGPPPPPPWAECSSSLGECLLDNDPEDRLECTCADGEMISMSGGNEWAGLSQDELFMECEAQLFEGCSVSAESSGTDTGDTDGSGSSGSTSASSSTGEPGDDTGVDGPPEGSSGTPDPGSTSDGSTGGASEGSDGGATGGDGGCSCSTSNRSSRSGWALALLGLVTLGLSRRRRARAA